MKRNIFLAAIVIMVLFPPPSFAELKTVTIGWTLANNSSTSGYKIYYSYNSNMSPKYLACEANDPSATSLTCSDVDIQQSPIYFTVVAVTNNGEISSTVKSAPANISQLSTVKNLRIVSPSQ